MILIKHEVFMDKVKILVDYIKSQTDFVPEIGLILTSGFKSFEKEFDSKVVISLDDIKGFPCYGKDKKNKIVIGRVNGRNVIALLGRVHSYLGYSPEAYAAPVFAMKELGCKYFITGTAVGAINTKYKVGDLFIAKDYINNSGENPLIGLSDVYGSKYFDMSKPYSSKGRECALKVAKELRIKTRDGILIEFCGPNGETAAEIRMARLFGADAVCSHIIKETVLARYCGLKTLSINLITNFASGYSDSRVKYEDIHYNMDVSSDYFCDYLADVIKIL